MVEVRLRDVSNYALRRVTDVFPEGKLSVLLGPNGAGKTTLLRVIAGLEKYFGHVLFDGRQVDDVPPYERSIAYVPQRNSLFKNMKVYDNIAFGLRARGYLEKEVKGVVRNLAESLRITDILDRYPARLSGGEARKVALARALAINPELIMLDEPFTGLDAEVSELIKQDIMMLLRHYRKTIILVSHSTRTSLVNADFLHVLWMGKLIYSGKLSQLDTNKLPECIRYWLGTTLHVDEIITEDGLAKALIGDSSIPLAEVPKEMQARKIIVLPDSVKICRKGSITGVIESVYRSGHYYRATINLEGNRDLRIYLTTPAPVRKGETVKLKITYGIPLGD